MGSVISSKKILTESDLSSESSDDSVEEVPEILQSEMQSSFFDVRTDAVLRGFSNPKAENVLSLDKVQDIEKELDNYEIISLVYLLYETAEGALRNLVMFIIHCKNNSLYEWAKYEQDLGKKWQEKLVEALCIIQNYQVLKKIGYDKDELKLRYFPQRAEISGLVSKLRKTMYLISENLSKEQTSQFIQYMKIEHTVSVNHFDENYLELYFLEWEQKHFDVENVKKVLKKMEMEKLCDMLNIALLQDPVVVPPKYIVKPSKQKLERTTSTTRDTTHHSQSSSLEESHLSSSTSRSSLGSSHNTDDNRYQIDPENPGVVLIIDQEAFYTETDDKYKDLLHEEYDKLKLDTRDGTLKDRTRLSNLFRKFGYRIVIKENLPHYDIIDVIQKEVLKINNESSFIVCILSHGDNGVIYGANSCKVPISQIEKVMCSKSNLIEKPKVLILQSCQGRNCQKLEEESSGDESSEYTKDGLNKVSSKAADFLTFSATIPGFAAIRNVNTGSWLIQSLCDEIEAMHAQCHFIDICTRVHHKISMKKWKEKTRTNIMTPVTRTTLRKAFYLPPMKNFK